MTTKELDELHQRYKEEIVVKKGLAENSSEFIDTWKYNHRVASCDLKIHIPPEYESAERFQGTLGHKVNHKFRRRTTAGTTGSTRPGSGR